MCVRHRHVRLAAHVRLVEAEQYAYSYVDDGATSVFTCKGRRDHRITLGITRRE
jgi:hypothetical protein